MNKLLHRFVELMPKTLEEGVLYVSITYGTAAHRCCCGCRREVVTPLTPTDWKLIFDGESVSLYPSIGNWNFPCCSHYWIRRNRVEWAEDWSAWQIDTASAKDRAQKEKYYSEKESDDSGERREDKSASENRFWSRFWSSW